LLIAYILIVKYAVEAVM